MNKKFIITLLSSLLLCFGIIISPDIAFALPYQSETMGPNNSLVTAPDTYIPSNRITIPNDSSLSLSSFNNPEDMIFDEETNKIYVSDTQNKRIIELDKNDNSYVKEYKSFINLENEEINFKTPIGLAKNKDYFLVADKGLQEIIVFNKDDMTFVREIKKPETNLIGSLTKFVPLKIAIDDRGNLYTVLEGSTKGVMELDIEGNFIGYIGVNKTESSLLSTLQNIFNFDDSDDYLLATGLPVTNIAIDSKGLVYTVTNKASDNTIKKLNTSGNAILSPNLNEVNTVHVYIDNLGNIISVQSDGYITVFDSYGSLLFRFGGRNDEEILGSLKSPVAISGTSNNELLVLDKEANLIIVYEPTHFTKTLYDAVSYYKDGLYLEGESSWKEVLRYNSKFILAYKALGKASMKKGDFETALKQFKIAEDKQDYSDAYWKIRDVWIRSNLGYVLIPIIFIIVLVCTYKIIKIKKYKLVEPLINFKNKICNIPIIKDIFFGFEFLKNPSNGVYEIKYKNKGSIIGAIVLYVFYAVLQILEVYLKGYLFNDISRNVDGIRTILVSVGLLFALVLANQFVSSVTDGEGKLKHTFIAIIYALMPYLLLAIPIFLVSRILTFNESFIYYVLLIICYGWCFINIIRTIMELHDYSLGKAIINILLTIICLILVLAFLFIIYLLGYQLFEFLFGLLKGV